MVSRKRKPNFPDRKISESFLQFAEPLLTPLGPSATKEQMNQVLQIAFTVWNAVVYESANSDTHHLQMDLFNDARDSVVLVFACLATMGAITLMDGVEHVEEESKIKIAEGTHH